MSFTSLTFWVFCLIVLISYWVIPERRWQNIILLSASYVFYGWASPWLAFMLGISTLIDFFLARGMRMKPTRTRSFMALSLFLNVGVLAFFK